MSDMYALFEKEKVDADKFDNVDKEGASKLSNFIRQSIQIQKDIEDAEQHLKDLKFKKRKVNEEDIPMLMEEMGMDSITVEGHKVTIRPFVPARILKTRGNKLSTFSGLWARLTSLRMMLLCRFLKEKIMW